jgi:hypothetical protein
MNDEHYVASDEWWIRKDLEGTGSSLIETLSRNLLGELRKTTRYLSHVSRYPGQDSNLETPEYKSRASPLDQLGTNSVFIIGQAYDRSSD